MEENVGLNEPLIQLSTIGNLKVSSQVILSDSEHSKSLQRPNSFRRDFLMQKAKSRGIPYSAVPISWKIPFLDRI